MAPTQVAWISLVIHPSQVPKDLTTLFRRDLVSSERTQLIIPPTSSSLQGWQDQDRVLVAKVNQKVRQQNFRASKLSEQRNLE